MCQRIKLVLLVGHYKKIWRSMIREEGKVISLSNLSSIMTPLLSYSLYYC